MKKNMGEIIVYKISQNFFSWIVKNTPFEIQDKDLLDHDMMLCAGGEL